MQNRTTALDISDVSQFSALPPPPLSQAFSEDLGNLPREGKFPSRSGKKVATRSTESLTRYDAMASELVRASTAAVPQREQPNTSGGSPA